jgi:hypothetical protein
MLSATGEHGNAAAISHHRDGQIQDPATRSIIYWAAATRSPGADILQAPPFSNREAPEIIGTAVFFHYVNRMASVLLSEAPLPSNQRWLRRPLKRMAAWYFSRAVQRSKLPGASLGLLPEAELPADLAWAEMAPNIAGAFARFAAVVDKAGVDLLSEEVRACVSEQVQTWSGEDPGLSQNWVEQAITGFDEASRAMARLLLLAALAPYQIDEGTSILS